MSLDNIDDLFASAEDDGLTDDTMDLVIANLNGPTMTGAVGIGLDKLAATDITLAMNIIDRSGSMAPHAFDLITAYNDDYLAGLQSSPAADDILVSTLLFNERVELFHGYVNLNDAPHLTRNVYAPRGSTALYDAVAGGLTNMVLYAQQLRQSGIGVNCLVLVYSDGDDNNSQQRADDIKRAADELLKQELYTLAYVGFGHQNNARTFRHQAAAIGFPEVAVAGLSSDELRRIFQMVSMSTVRVSQQVGQKGKIF